MWDIVWVSPQGHSSVSVSRHFLLQAPQCPCSVRKRLSRDHCCRGRSKPGCRFVGSHTRWELTTGADFQLCLHRLLTSAGYNSMVMNVERWVNKCVLSRQSAKHTKLTIEHKVQSWLGSKSRTFGDSAQSKMFKFETPRFSLWFDLNIVQVYSNNS